MYIMSDIKVAVGGCFPSFLTSFYFATDFVVMEMTINYIGTKISLIIIILIYLYKKIISICLIIKWQMMHTNSATEYF